MEKEELTLIARQCLELEIDENSKMPICRALIPKGRFINISLDTATLNIDFDFDYGETVDGVTVVIINKIKNPKYNGIIEPNDIIWSLGNISSYKRTHISSVEDIPIIYEFYRNNRYNSPVLIKLKRQEGTSKFLPR
jgi:hypothetical protein